MKVLLFPQIISKTARGLGSPLVLKKYVHMYIRGIESSEKQGGRHLELGKTGGGRILKWTVQFTTLQVKWMKFIKN